MTGKVWEWHKIKWSKRRDGSCWKLLIGCWSSTAEMILTERSKWREWSETTSAKREKWHIISMLFGLFISIYVTKRMKQWRIFSAILLFKKQHLWSMNSMVNDFLLGRRKIWLGSFYFFLKSFSYNILTSSSMYEIKFVRIFSRHQKAT